MTSSLSFVCGNKRYDLNDRSEMVMERGYAPEATVEDEHITETVKVQIRKFVPDIIEGLNIIFEKARTGDPTDDKVYVEYKVDDDEIAWRSRVYNAVLQVTSAVASQWPKGRVDVEISFERDPFWEGPESSIQIANVNTQSGLAKVYNCNDGVGSVPNKRINFANVNALVIKGELPTPVKLEITNLSTNILGGLWIGMNNSRPDWIDGWSIEAEAATGVTPVTAAGASGGAFVQGNMTYGQAQAALKWSLSDSLMSAVRGQRVRMLLRAYYLGAYQNFKYQLKITHGVTSVWESAWVRPAENYSRHWLELFDFQLPPWLDGLDDLSGLTLELWLTPSRAGTWTWAFDDVLLLAQDGFVSIDTNVETQGKVIIEGDKGWAETAAGKKHGLRKMTGELMLKPAAVHRFVFAMHSIYGNSAPIDFSLRVQGSYRPRRRSI